MKTSGYVALCGLALTLTIGSTAAKSATDHAVVEQGAHHRVWARVSWSTNRLGQASARTNAYTELATGLHRWQDGRWQEASTTIESFPGGAIARQGQHQVVFASDLATAGAIDLQTPDGKRLRSHLVGLGYYDAASGKSVVFAEVTNSLGVVVPPNQVVYGAAFSGVRASVRYTYTLAGLEQDVVLEEQPPAPELFGLNAKSSRLQVFTEFLSPPAPLVREEANATTRELPDPLLDFGVMKMARGLAFPADAGEGSPTDSIPVSKRWQALDGRQFLIEEVPVPRVAPQLEKLPVKQATLSPTIRQAAVRRHLPLRAETTAKSPRPMELARLQMPARGFVLDYTLMTSETNFTFQSDTTYYVSGLVNLSGTTTIEAAAIVKYTNTTSAKLNLLGTVDCQTDSYRPAVFTAKDDDSVGEIITGSTGAPSGYYGYMLAGPSAALTFHDCRFLYGNRAITHSGNLHLTNVQFVACSRPIYAQGSDHTITVDNALFHTNGMVFDHGIGAVFCGQHLTLQQAGSIAATSGSVDCRIYLTNCLIAGLTSWGKNVEDSYTNQVAWLTNGAGLFQNVGAGTHYLAESSPYRNVGTTNIGANFLPAIQAMTTYPPPVSTVDTNTPDLGYHYPVLTDFDLDGMEDGWEWKHFGTLTNNGSGDYDGDGTSDLTENQGGTEPNDIVFDVQFENLWVHTNTASGSFIVLKGHPAQVAVLVDSTNFAAASWSNYNGTVTAPLGGTDGTYQVWIGLKGRASDSTASWGDWPITRDTVPPAVTITNPTVATLSRPILQLQGYGIEPLASVRYDLTNAAGSLTNVAGYVTKQWFDTNMFEFTTNWFECVDIGLTNGTNRVTLRATDRAGNVTTNAYEYVLDYSGDTTPPALAVYWPQNGTLVSGTNFALRGWLDDPTATIIAEVVDASGATNTGKLVIERDGLLWVEDLPLGAGTNTLTLTMTDAAGNVSVTNLDCIQSAVVLAIDDLSGVNVNQRRVTITGTINVTNHTVWVNGVQASVTGQNGQGLYTWNAVDVPVNEGGTALFQAVAIPNTDNGGNGSGGNGGSFTSFASSGNPASANGTPAESERAKEPEIVTIHYHRIWRYEYVEDAPSTFTDVRTADIKWQLNSSGYWKNDECYGSSYNDDYYYGWNQRLWDQFDIGIIQGRIDRGHKADVCGVRDLHIDDYPYTPPSWPGETCKGSERRRDFYADSVESVSRDARTLYELHTGGKKESGRKALFRLSASATGIGNMFYPDPDNDEDYTMSYAIANDSIELGDLGKLGSDGVLYKALGDGETHNVTPTVPGCRYYRYDQPGHGKHTPHIYVNTGTKLEPDTVAPDANYVVGQVLNFNLGWTTEDPPSVTAKTDFEWTVQGNWLNHEEQSIPGCASCSPAYSPAANSLNQEVLTNCWWTSGGTTTPQEYEVTFREKLHFSNGQEAEINALGLFTMLRPVPEFTAQYRDTAQVFQDDDGWHLQFGRNSTMNNVGIAFEYANAPVEINTGATYGKYFLAQVVNSTTHKYNLFSSPPCDGNCDHGYETNLLSFLDGSFPYQGEDNPCETPTLTSDKAVYWIDAPGVGLSIAHWYRIDDSFSMWLMFQPPPYPQTKHVPMFKVGWGWYGSATNCPTWGYKSGQPTPASPQVEPTEAYPSWIFTLSGHIDSWPTNMHQTSCFSED